MHTRKQIEALWKTLRLHFHLFFFFVGHDKRAHIYEYNSQTTKMQQTENRQRDEHQLKWKLFLPFFFFSPLLIESIWLMLNSKIENATHNATKKKRTKLFECKKFTSIKWSKVVLSVVLCSVFKFVGIFAIFIYQFIFRFKFTALICDLLYDLIWLYAKFNGCIISFFFFCKTWIQMWKNNNINLLDMRVNV